MNSKKLIIKLKKQGVTQYKIGKICGMSDQAVSNVKGQRRNFTADQLGLLKKAGVITEEEVLKVNYYDNLKDKKLYKLVASLLVAPVMHVAYQITEGVNQLCILC